jgi:PilZ domain-containing protein
MRLNSRLARERLSRLRQRVHSAPLQPVTRRIQVSEKLREWYHPAGASSACGTSAASRTWADKPCGRRLTERVALSSPITVRRSGGFPFEVRLGNVSAGGCRIELVEGTEVDERVIARFPGLEPFAARVTWVEARDAGLAFDKPMHAAVFAHLLSRID